MYPSKTYKVRPLYSVLYQVCSELLSDKKNILLKSLLIQQLGVDRTQELSLFSFNQLITKMVHDLKGNLDRSSYPEVKDNVFNQDRFKTILKEFTDLHGPSSVLTHITFRVEEEVVNTIAALKHKTLGDVIELAIANYIVSCEDDIYKLILQALYSYHE
ncbi:hypothetical protein WMO40_20800 [Bacillaceae bacterium CLA-AA-H227]|uniref:Uncharacterized protein n=2 Tax=Robertmurraya TaxID=2837507 RepID=A0A4U1D209_9BACI|nr:hypothetical protein [Robertmurraya kyonggiensis]TKC15197.1 hypothetical protein FA727_20155 [Robertmurraya kyonggiensis]